MKLIMTLLVRDEIDIIRENIEFHLASGVDHIIATDNGSIDGTREVLEEYRKLGCVSIIDEPDNNFAQSDWASRAILIARDDMEADWVFSNDADEFWLAPQQDLKLAILHSKSDLLSCTRRNMVYSSDSDDSRPWSEKVRYRVRKPKKMRKVRDIYTSKLRQPYFYLDLPPKVIFQPRFFQSISMGNHAASFDQRVRKQQGMIDVYHYPIRSFSQFERKIRQGGRAYENNLELPERVGWHWRRWYKMLQDEGMDAVIREVLPNTEKLASDLRAGRVIEDQKMSALLQRQTNSFAAGN